MMRTSHRSAIDRRDLLCAGGVAAYSALIAGLLGGTRPARAQPVAGPVPEVDKLSVRVVTDNYQIAVAPSPKVPNVVVERFGWPLSSDAPGPTLFSEFGLSLLAESQKAQERRRVLVDFGYTPEALLNNTHVLGIDPASLDALVLSHGHYDHFGGLLGFLHANQGRLKPGIPFLVGGEECFCARAWTAPPVQGNFGTLDRNALQAADVLVTIVENASVVAGHGFTTGQVPRNTFEKLLSPSKMKVGVKEGLGCYPERMPADERGSAPIPDQFRHEIGTAYNVKGRGLVILTSCSHRGVVNIVKQAQAVSGVRKVHAVIGGFHLAPYPADYVGQSIASLKEIDPDYVIPMHCTGEPFWDMAKAEMPAKLIRSYTGTRFAFGA